MRKKLFFLIAAILLLSALLVSAAPEKVILRINADADTSLKDVINDIKQHPFMIYFKLGVFYFRQEEYDAAIDAFKKSLAIKPDFSEAQYNLGVVYYEQRKHELAEEAFNQAIALHNNYARAHYSIALLYYGKKQYDEAIEHFLKLTELEEDNSNAHFDLGIAYADRFRYSNNNLDDLREAIKYFKKAEQIQNGFPHALENANILNEILQEYAQNS